MKITDIKKQVKRSDRYSIYGDNKYVFSLSENELLNSGIKINQEYDGEELERLQRVVVLDKAYDRSLNMISRRPRSIWEMKQYLKQKDYSEDVIEEVLNKLSNRKYIDDQKFAEAWVRDRRLLKKTSKRRLQQELRAKRVSDEIIQKVLLDDETDEHEVLKQLIEKKRSQTRYQDDQKLIQYLIRQGFNYSDIKGLISV
ncbi:hypothetical protein A3F37_01290 [Candidatus Saccharibacteria bacterium RIFCSPHIGHO2_12_FULL_41_12]|nr:MAG: hypothetical protein A3F37_01290 [Candidatus Saccharibacteria bacterium RIFCSPHIGHO2_12_FULL_41_12]